MIRQLVVAAGVSGMLLLLACPGFAGEADLPGYRLSDLYRLAIERSEDIRIAENQLMIA